MAREIMVPLDGTRFAEAALPTAMALARRDGARLRLVSVWQGLPPQESESSWEKERRDWQVQDRARLDEYMRATAATVKGAAGVHVEVAVVEGPVDEALPSWSATSSIDLAVMSTHARTPLTRAWLGSAADHMVRQGRHPVLLSHPTTEEPTIELKPAAPFRRVLVTLDGSELAETALDASILSGRAKDVDITLLRVVQPPARSMPAHLPETDVHAKEALDQARSDAERDLETAASRIGGWAHGVETDVVVDQAVAKAIASYASRHGFDLIAMATHGRSGIPRAVLGSVADQVMRTATVPVLLFPPRSS